jgi:hypothetical protein
MSYLHPDGMEGIHVMLPSPWKEHIWQRAKKNRRTPSEEIRETLRLAYKLEVLRESKKIILPEGLRPPDDENGEQG